MEIDSIDSNLRYYSNRLSFNFLCFSSDLYSISSDWICEEYFNYLGWITETPLCKRIAKTEDKSYPKPLWFYNKGTWRLIRSDRLLELGRAEYAQAVH